MKKMIKFLTVVALTAMGLTACQNEFDEPTMVQEEVVVNFVAESADTRTVVDTSGDVPLFSWGANETFAVLEQTDALAKATSYTYENVDGIAHIKATFEGNVGKGLYEYITVYPESGYVAAESIDNATLTLPAEQTMAEESYDPAADLMVSKVVTTNEQPSASQTLQFTRLAAVVKMSLKNFELESGDQVEKVIFTAEGKTLAGNMTADLTAPHETAAVAESGSSSVAVATTAADDIYFTALPATLEEGEKYSITVVTTSRIYVKQGAIGEGKSLVFQAGMVTRFGVNMADVVAGKKWVLVRDASTLEQGDIVTIAAVNNNFVLGCSSGTNYPYASYNTNIIKVGDYLYHPIVTDKSKYQHMVQPLVLSKQDAAKPAFDFYNAEGDYEGDTKSGYLTNAQTNNYLQLVAYPSKNSAFEISIENGVATIEATESEFDNTLLKFFNNNPNSTTSTYRRFVCIDAASIEAAKHDDVCIYKLAGEKGDVPVAGAVVVVPEEDEPVVIPVEGVAEETACEEVKFTYVGDWTIDVESDAAWLTVNYADGVLYYYAGANDGAVRRANVKITATHDGEEAKEYSFLVVQKGAPVKVTIAEFITKEVDPNVDYVVTGKLSQKPTSASGTTKIKDAAGNEAQFAYVYMTDNTTPFSSDKVIELGDIVTITAAVSSKGKGGSNSAHAICEGYYNLESSVANDLVAYTGGSVKLTLIKEGTLNPAGNITCTASEKFATLDYTTNAYSATATLSANDGAPRQVEVTFTDGYASTSVTIVQSADTNKGNTWELVTDASTLADGDIVVIAAKDYDVAMGTTISSERRNAVAVTKLGNYYITPTLDVQTLILAKGSINGTFAFYDGVNSGFLVSSSESYKLNNNGYINDDTSFAISIEDGVATIGNTEGTYAKNKLYYREANDYFYSGTTAKEAICLYRLVGGKGTIPVIPADVTVPSEKVVIAEEGAAEATPISGVVFNYVGEWNITAAADVDWINFAYDKATNTLNYTALANDGTVREATATITAAMEGQTSKTWTFDLLQKGKPMEISIEEFRTKGKDENVTYKLTGVVTTVPSSYSGAYVIEDAEGNKADIKYLRLDDGSDYVVSADNPEIKVGDVITVTTVVTSTTKGAGGSSTYPSFLKGYYRLTATTDNALVGYEGGTSTITLATEGDMIPADATITGAPSEAYDFVTFDYTENAATATAKFAANSSASRNAEFVFKFGMASAAITIGQENDPSVKVGWFLVTDVNELAAGDKVIIAAKSPDETGNYAIKKYTSTSSNANGIAIELMGNSISSVDGVEQFTLESGLAEYAGTWAFKNSSNSRYLYTDSNNVKIKTTVDRTGSWAISIAPDGKATLTSQTATTSRNTMMLNYTASNQTFGVYGSTQTGKGAIYIYKYYNSLSNE